MKFLLEILGMTNYCNLNCAYCDWEKKPYFNLEEKDIKVMKSNINKLSKFIYNNYPEIQIVEYSGGEPFLYPEIIQELLNAFRDKWIRIITNGLLIKDEHIKQFKERGKIFIAVSLDGHTLDLNKSRFGTNQKNFDKVINTLDKLVLNEIPTMILCTLSEKNINSFPEYIDFIEKRYSKAISRGKLVLPAHSICDYGKDRGRADKYDSNNFIKYIEEENGKHPIIKNILKHYENLGYFLKNRNRFRPCKLYDWSISVHFRGDQIVKNGNFNSFGCGMRGLVDFGIKNINNDIELIEYKQQIDKDNLKEIFENPIKAPYQCRKECFVDWEAFDLILNGDISVEEAEAWFEIFKDKNIKEFIKNYKF